MMLLERVCPPQFSSCTSRVYSSWSPQLGELEDEGQGTLSRVLDHGDPLIRQSQPCDDWPLPAST